MDQFPVSQFRSAEYTIQMTDNSNNYHTTRLLVNHDTGTAHSTEYATVISNTALSVVTTDVLSGNLVVRVTPANVNVVYKFARLALVV